VALPKLMAAPKPEPQSAAEATVAGGSTEALPPAHAPPVVETDAVETDEGEPAEFKNQLAAAPDGRLGKLLVHKSGKLKLHIGEHVYDVR